MRRKEYTAIGVRRVLCSIAGCTRRGYASWQICADGRLHRAICPEHDIELNAMVLRWTGDPDAGVKMELYREKVYARVGAPV